MENKKIFIEVKRKLKEFLPLEKLKFQIKPRVDNIRPDFIADFILNDINLKLIGEIIERESTSVLQKRISQLKFYERQKPECLPILIARYFIYQAMCI